VYENPILASRAPGCSSKVLELGTKRAAQVVLGIVAPANTEISSASSDRTVVRASARGFDSVKLFATQMFANY